MKHRSEHDAGPGAARASAGVLRLLWLSTMLPFVVCLPLWGILAHAPQPAFVELDRLDLGADIEGLWQYAGPGGDRLVLSASDHRLHVLERTSGTLQQHLLDLPLDILGEGPVTCSVTDYDADGLDDLIVRHQMTMDEYGEEAEEVAPSLPPCAIYLQRDGELSYAGSEPDRQLDPTTQPHAVICNRWLTYGTRTKNGDTLLIPTTRGAVGRLLQGQVLASADLDDDARDEILTAEINPAEPLAELVLYRAARRGYRIAWRHQVDTIAPEVDGTNPQPLAALADLAGDWRAELILCQRSPGIVRCYVEAGPEAR